MADTAELVVATRSGDGAALGLLLQRHRAWSYAVALGYLRDPVEAQDAVQYAFLVAVQHVGSLRAPDAFTP
ncbi:MAG: hypothetical protein KY462_09225 [Actinobacteria bacterium]|nr:hypothetical protein [Actinomycetota bacterium]